MTPHFDMALDWKKRVRPALLQLIEANVITDADVRKVCEAHGAKYEEFMKDIPQRDGAGVNSVKPTL